jgi:hypothetical protein
MPSATRYRLKREIRIHSMGDLFAGGWQSNHCPLTFKKMIFCTAIEEIIVRANQDKKSLELLIHWKGGAHTQLAMERPRSTTKTATPMLGVRGERIDASYRDRQSARSHLSEWTEQPSWRTRNSNARRRRKGEFRVPIIRCDIRARVLYRRIVFGFNLRYSGVGAPTPPVTAMLPRFRAHPPEPQES